MLKLMLSVLLMFFALETWAQNDRTHYINDASGVDPEACMQIVSRFTPSYSFSIGANNQMMYVYEIGKNPQGKPSMVCKKKSIADQRNRMNPRPYDLNALKRSDCSCEGKIIIKVIE